MAEYIATRASAPLKSVPGTNSQAPNAMGSSTTTPQQEAAHRISPRTHPFVEEPQPTPSTSESGRVKFPLNDGAWEGSVTPSAKSVSDHVSTARATTSGDDKQSKISSSPTPPILANPVHLLPPRRYEPSGGHGAAQGDPTAHQSPSNSTPVNSCEIPPPGTPIRRERDQNVMATPTVEKAIPNAPALLAASSPGPISSPSTCPPVLTRTREEQLYHETKYLVAPHPPNELGRRTALHKLV